jgi:ATP-dependent DNA helicase RecQ
VPTETRTFTRSEVIGTIRRYWGFDRLRPIQEDAIRAALRGRDSLVVMPTGGGKSLCYQAPPLLLNRLAVVVSPLISLMKDQVDGLRLAGYPAAALYTGVSPNETRQVEQQLSLGELRLLFLAPERLLTTSMLTRLAKLDVSAFAIDEAHCISQWGHDFRPEYRRLAELREIFPGAAFNAFTATATERVREDIVDQLHLRDPAVLVGRFDRPNLTYRVVPRVSLDQQVAEAVQRHTQGEHAGATIVYCLSRKDTEALANMLRARGIEAAAYHAGLEADERARVQDDFSNERLNVVVATVAFGMGIDRSNVRCVVHACMPKSIEHYQQETGRAGRDGLASECVLIYSPGDAVRWEKLMTMSAAETEGSEAALRVQFELLRQMQRLAEGGTCRHKALSEYFGQEYEPPERAGASSPRSESPPAPDRGEHVPAHPTGCGACDVCLEEMGEVADSTTIVQKILSCVFRCGQNFGAAHITDVLRGSRSEKIIQWKHDLLSTHGLLRSIPKPTLMGYIGQLIDQGLLERRGEFNVLVLTEKSMGAMKGEVPVRLLEAKSTAVAAASRDRDSTGPLSDEDLRLFEALRKLRLDIARERGVPPYVVFHDTVLKDLARLRPTTIESMRRLPGVGDRKLADLGPRMCEFVRAYCERNKLAIDRGQSPRSPSKPRGQSRPRAEYFRDFADGKTPEEIAQRFGISTSTAYNHLAAFIVDTRPEDVSRWIDGAALREITEFASTPGEPSLKVIFEHFHKKFTYDQIQVATAFLRSRESTRGV